MDEIVRGQWNFFSVRFAGSQRSAVLILVLLLSGGLGAIAQSVSPLILSQTEWLSGFPSGRVLDSSNAAGTSFAVNSDGDIIVGNTYGNEVLLENASTGTMTSLGSFQNVGAVAVDGQNNLYIGGLYTGFIVKLPYANGAYAPLTVDPNDYPQVPLPPLCKGGDTSECLWGTNLFYSGNNYWFGIVSMTFAPDGSFFFATNGTNGSTSPYPPHPFSIFECDTTCVATAGTGTGNNLPSLLYSEPPSGPSPSCSSSATVQVTPGSIAVDSAGNLFFTDSALDTCNASNGVNQSDYSTLKELAKGSSAPVLLYQLTPQPPVSYDDEVDAVAISGNGTVYFGTQDDGIYAFADDGTPFTYEPTVINTVSTIGTKAIALGPTGELYIVSNVDQGSTGNYIDTLGHVALTSVDFTASAVGTLSAAIASVIDNRTCPSLPAIQFTAEEDNLPTSEFSGTVSGGSCVNNIFGGLTYVGTATLTATPSAVGTRSAWITVTASDGSSVNSTAYTTGLGANLTLDPGGQPSAFGGFTSPAAIAVDAAADMFVADSGANAVFEIAGGSGGLISLDRATNHPSGIAMAANGNLYIADSGNNRIISIAPFQNPIQQSTLISDTDRFNGVILNDPSGLTVGPRGMLYIADTGNNRVIAYNPLNGLAAVQVTGLNHPEALAAGTSGSLYIANLGTGAGDGSVEAYSAGHIATITPNGVTAPAGLVVDASGSIIVSDQSTGNIVRIPNENGTPNPADAAIIERNPSSGGGLALDAMGDLYTSDPLGASVYSIQRTMSAIDFGTVEDGSSSSLITVRAENAGNAVLAQQAGLQSFLTSPSSSMFTLGAGNPNDCITATTLAPGLACQFTAQFSPTYGTPSGPVNATANFRSGAINQSTALINMSANAVYLPQPTTPTPTFNPPTGTYSSAQSVMLTDSDAGASIYYTTDGSTPSLNSALYSGPISVALSETIQAIALAPGYASSPVASATYTIPSGFSISLGSSLLTLASGGEVGTELTVVPLGGFNSAIMFSCSGLPTGTACVFSPSTVTPKGQTSSTSQLTVVASSTLQAESQSSNPFFPGAIAACSLLLFGFRRRNRLWVMLLIVASVTSLGLVTGCGTEFRPQPGKSTVTVTATSGGLKETTTFTLVIQPPSGGTLN